MNISDRSLVGAFLSIFSASVVTLVISVVFTPLLVRVLGADQYGDYAFILSVLAMCMIFANSGVTRGVKKFIAEENRSDSWQSDVFGFYTKVSLLLPLAISLPILLLSTTGFFGLVDERFVLYFQLMAVVIVTKQLYWFTLNALRGMGYERYSEPIKVLHRVSFACLALWLAYLGYGVVGVLGGYILSLVLSISVTTIILSRIVDFRAIVSRHTDLPRGKLLSFNLLTVLLVLMMDTLYNFDIILLRTMTSSTQTGYYKAALVVAQLMWILPRTLQTLLLHSSSNYWSTDEYEKINRISSLATRLILVICFLMAAGLFVLADDFMPLYFGSEFSAAVTSILLLLPGVIGFAVARPMYAIGQGSGNLRVLITATGSAAAINVVLNIILIPLYGMEGAAVATSIGYGSMAYFYTVASRKIGFYPARDLRVRKIAVATVLATAVMYSLDLLVGNPYLSLLLIPVVGSAVYLVAILRTGAVSEQEVRRLTGWLPDGLSASANRVLSALT